MTTPELVALLKKNPLLVGCGVLSLALAVTIYFRGDLIAEANAELDQKTGEAQRYALNLSNAAQLKEQMDALTAANQAIQARLVRPTEIGINQQYFYKLESETGVKLLELNQSMRAATPAKGATFVPVTFTVSAQGDFPHVMAFLRALENGAHFCRVVTASCSGGRGGAVNLSLTLELLGQP